jgi:hypothetical protein
MRAQDRRTRGLIAIAAISLGGLCLAWWQDDNLFAAVFAAAAVIAVLEALRRVV